jgi:arabinogalactan endo-1,4-beta-galactosidase
MILVQVTIGLAKKITGFILLMTLLMAGCSKDNNSGGDDDDDDEVIVLPPTTFAKGADVSWITQMEASGRKFYNKAGTETEGMALLKSLGMNTIRLRVWVNPTPVWNDVNDVVAKAVRAKNLGMRIMINFHYSDSWADPGKQTKPAAWNSLVLSDLRNALSTHTTQVLTALKNNGVKPEWVQIGNETNDGMLWPNGRASQPGGMANYAYFINAGYDATKAIFPQARVIVHLSNGYDNGLFTWNIGGLISNGAKFDVIGMSLYPSPTDWATRTAQCLVNMNDMVTKYNKEVMVLEIGMSWDQAAASKAFIADLITKVKSVKDNKGIGVLYWEPQCYGNWQGYTLGAFDNSGKPTEALDSFAD